MNHLARLSKRTLLGNSFLLIAIFCLGCERPPGVSIDEPCGSRQETRESSGIDIYFDGTESMLGFVKGDESAMYKRLVLDLELAAQKTWEAPTVNYFKFGEIIVPVQGRGFLNAVQPEFYGDKNLKLDTYIDSVIMRADTAVLTLIVTDLFQQQSDISLVVKRITDKYARSGFSVGLWGIRSSFHGTIFDIGPEKKKIVGYHSVKGKVDTYRPFYLLMFGYAPEIKRYQEILRASILDQLVAQQDNFALITSQLFEPPLTLRGSKLVKLGNSLRTNGQICLVASGQDLVSRLEFVGRNPDPDTVIFEMIKPVIPQGLEIDWTKLQFRVMAYELASRKSGDVHEKRNMGEDMSIKKLNSDTTDSGGLSVTLKIAPPGNSSREVDYFELEPELGQKVQTDSTILPKWIRNWDMDPQIVYGSWSGHQNEIAPSTWNLRNFVETLWATWFQSQPPCLGRVVIIVKS